MFSFIIPSGTSAELYLTHTKYPFRSLSSGSSNSLSRTSHKEVGEKQTKLNKQLRERGQRFHQKPNTDALPYLTHLACHCLKRDTLTCFLPHYHPLTAIITLKTVEGTVPYSRQVADPYSLLQTKQMREVTEEKLKGRTNSSSGNLIRSHLF